MAHRPTWSEKARIAYYKLFNWAYNQIRPRIDGPIIKEDDNEKN